MQTHRPYSPQQIAALVAASVVQTGKAIPSTVRSIAMPGLYGQGCPWPGATHARARRSHISRLRRDYFTQRDARGRYDKAGKRIDVRQVDADGFRQ